MPTNECCLLSSASLSHNDVETPHQYPIPPPHPAPALVDCMTPPWPRKRQHISTDSATTIYDASKSVVVVLTAGKSSKFGIRAQPLCNQAPTVYVPGTPGKVGKEGAETTTQSDRHMASHVSAVGSHALPVTHMNGQALAHSLSQDLQSNLCKLLSWMSPTPLVDLSPMPRSQWRPSIPSSRVKRY